MTSKLADQITRLDAERDRLEGFLARHAGWQAWDAAARDPASDLADVERREAEVAADLAGNPVFTAWQAVRAATAAVREAAGPYAEAAVATAVADQPALQQAALETAPEAVPEPEPGPVAQPPLRSSGAAEPPTLQDVKLVSLSRGSRPAATIRDLPPEATRTAPAAERPPDDLTRIRRIDRSLADALQARGVRRYDDIAAFTPADVRTLAAALSLGRRISQENWIEQAAILAVRAVRARAAEAAQPAKPRRDLPSSAAEPNLPAGLAEAITILTSTVSAAELQPEPATGTPAVDAARTVTIGEPSGTAEPVAAEEAGAPSAVPELIRVAAQRIAEQMAVAGRPSLADPRADGSPDASEALDGVPGDERPVVTTPIGAHEGAPSREQPPRIEETALTAAAIEKPAPTPEPSCDLTLIRAINAPLAARLRDLGIASFAEIADWRPRDVRTVRAALGLGRRIASEGWIEQAAILARGGTTAHAARRRAGDLDVLVPPPAGAARDPGFAVWLARQTSELAIARPTSPQDVQPPPVPPQPADGPPVLPSTTAMGAMPSAPPAPATEPTPVPDEGHPAMSHSAPTPTPGESPAPSPVPAAEEAPASGLTDEPAPATGDETAPRQNSIAARLKALERDLAALEIVPLSPPQPRRMVLPPVVPPVAGVASPAQPPTAEPALAELRWQDDTLRRVLDQTREADVGGIASGEPSLAELSSAALGEADVVIIRQVTREIGLEPLPVSAPPTPEPRASEHAAFDPGEDFDSAAYAAYRESVEEAIVEIVVQDDEARAPAAATAESASEAADSVDRFLKALKGT